MTHTAKHKMVRVPNCFIEMFDKSAELQLACAFYSLIHANTEKDLNGDYVISVSQETLAQICGCSAITISRAAAKLLESGFITSQRRPVTNRKAASGALMLDKYTYVVRFYSCETNFFTVDKALLHRLSGAAFRVYILFCKLSDNNTRSFFHSLKDMSNLGKIAKGVICKAITWLEKMGFIKRQKKITVYGDYTDNSYIVCIFITPQIKKRKKVIKKISPCSAKQGTEKIVVGFEKTTNLLDCIIQHIKGFVKGFAAKIDDFFLKRIKR